MTVTCFGELLLRLTPPGRQMLVQANGLDLCVGGAEANVAVALASLGHEVRFIGVLPENALGSRALNALRSAGVDTTGVARRPGRMGLYFLEEGAGSRPSTITYDRADSAFSLARPYDLAFANGLKGARLLHTGGITPALGPGGVDLARAAHAAAREAGVPICFDGNYRGALWQAWDSNAGEVLRDLVADATILIGNHRDIALLLEKPFSGEGETRRREAAEAAFSAFPRLEVLASTARHIVTGAHHRIAARVDTRAESYQTAETDVTDIVDRIGTGDAFAAGVLDGWLRGAGEQEMAETGLAMGLLKHSIPGDMAPIQRPALEGFASSASDVRR